MGFLDKLFKKNTPPPAQPPAGDDDDGDFVDIDLPIVTVNTLPSGALRIEARGTIDGEDVGLAVELGAQWSARPLENSPVVLHWGQGAYERTGPQSDRFVALLARRYGLQPPQPLAMLPHVDVALVGLNSDPTQVKTAPLHAKAFFHSDRDSEDTPEAEARYAEVFTNVALQGRVLQVHEKDPGYRLPLLRALTEP